ncbi:MAG: hypothetical protein RL098_1266 [Bacteroidota bacterium]
MTKNAILLLLLFFSTFVLSQRNTQKGLAALQAHNYGVAASYFQKDLTKSPMDGQRIIKQRCFTKQIALSLIFLNWRSNSKPAIPRLVKSYKQT